ncbi:MAG TPA: hypothetical protein VMW64_00865 [Dehalococcoidia bacterium]|nr:hypothetical protein [Dehalococcoidia bacterium]
MEMEKESLVQAISDFALANGLQIHPGQTASGWADLVLKKGGCCPCVPGRAHCPCEESLQDIREINRCRCGLFCNETYLEEYNRLTEAQKGRGKKWNRRPKISS